MSYAYKIIQWQSDKNIANSRKINIEKPVDAVDVAMTIPTISLSAHGIYALAAFSIFVLLVVTFLLLCMAFECGPEDTKTEEEDEEVSEWNFNIITAML